MFNKNLKFSKFYTIIILNIQFFQFFYRIDITSLSGTRYEILTESD